MHCAEPSRGSKVTLTRTHGAKSPKGGPDRVGTLADRHLRGAALRALLERTQRASVLAVTALALAVMPASSLGATRTFSYTGAEQTYTVPDAVTTLFVTATGARGGGPTSGTSLLPGEGAVAMGKITVTPGETLYV